MSLKHAILILLDEAPATGYDLMKRFKDGLGYFWNASHQQVYQQLKLMLQDQWVTAYAEQQTDKPDKKVYQVTEKGRQELDNWLSGPVKPNRINDALLVKLYGGHHLQPEQLLEELQAHRQIHEKTLKKLQQIETRYLAMPATTQARYQLPYLTLRRGLLGESAWLAWADEVKESLVLRKLPSSP